MDEERKPRWVKRLGCGLVFFFSAVLFVLTIGSLLFAFWFYSNDEIQRAIFWLLFSIACGRVFSGYVKEQRGQTEKERAEEESGNQ